MYRFIVRSVGWMLILLCVFVLVGCWLVLMV